MTNGDRKMLAVALGPLALLGILFVAAGAKWRSEERQIRPQLVEQFGAEIVDADCPTAAAYAARTDDSKTLDLRELLHAFEGLNDRYDLMFRALDQSNDSVTSSWMSESEELNRYLDEYLEQAAPLFQRFRDLNVDPNKVWLPHEHGNPQSWSRDRLQLFALNDSLEQEFRAAVRVQDTNRAIEAVRLGRRTGIEETGNNRFSISIADAMSVDMWTSEDLKQLINLLNELPDLESQWRQEIRSAQLRRIEPLLHGGGQDEYGQNFFAEITAPSQRIEVLDRARSCANVKRFHSSRAAEQAIDLDRRENLSHSDAIDTAIQFPLYGRQLNLGFHLWYQTLEYTRRSNDRRFIRTAIAVRQYAVQFGSFPERLSDLSKVGLAKRMTLDPTGAPFLYEAEGDKFRLGNASEWFPYYPGSARNFNTPGGTLATLLDRYHEVHFAADLESTEPNDK